MKPRLGLHEDIWAGRHATEQEKELGAWAAEQGLFVVCSSYEYDNDQGETISEDVTSLGIEELVDDKIHCYMIDLPTQIFAWPELREHHAKLLRAGLERNKEQHDYATQLIQMVLDREQ